MAKRVVIVLYLALFLPIIISERSILGTHNDKGHILKASTPCNNHAVIRILNGTKICTCSPGWYGDPLSWMGCQRQYDWDQIDARPDWPWINDCGVNAKCRVSDCEIECMCLRYTIGNPYVMCHDIMNDTAVTVTIRMADWSVNNSDGVNTFIKEIIVLDGQSLTITIEESNHLRLVNLQYHNNDIPFEVAYKLYNGSFYTIIMIPKITKNMGARWKCSFLKVFDDTFSPEDRHFHVAVKDAKKKHDRKEDGKDATSSPSYVPLLISISLGMGLIVTVGCVVCYFKKLCFFRSATDTQNTIGHTRLKDDNLKQNSPMQFMPESQAQSAFREYDYVETKINEISHPPCQTQIKPTIETKITTSSFNQEPHLYEEIDNCMFQNQASSTDDQDRSSPTYDYAYDHMLL